MPLKHHVVKCPLPVNTDICISVFRKDNKTYHNDLIIIHIKTVSFHKTMFLHELLSVKKNVFSAKSNSDFNIWYGEAVVRRQIVKITSGDIMSRVPQRAFPP